jgi:hypothetical protein
MTDQDTRDERDQATPEPDLIFMLTCYDAWSAGPAACACRELTREQGAG